MALLKNSSERRASQHGREDGRLRRLGHARRILGRHRRASRRARGRRTVRRQPHGRDRSARPAGARSGAARHRQRRLETQARPSPIFGAALRDTADSSTTSWCTKSRDEHYFLCVNASNQDKDYEHIVANNRFDATVENAGPRFAQLAIQGPLATGVVQETHRHPILPPSSVITSSTVMFSGAPARIARTGYTGEDGWEIYVAPEHAVRLWNEILAAGADAGIHPLRPGRAQHPAHGIGHAALRARNRRDHHALGSRA